MGRLVRRSSSVVNPLRRSRQADELNSHTRARPAGQRRSRRVGGGAECSRSPGAAAGRGIPRGSYRRTRERVGSRRRRFFSRTTRGWRRSRRREVRRATAHRSRDLRWAGGGGIHRPSLRGTSPRLRSAQWRASTAPARGLCRSRPAPARQPGAITQSRRAHFGWFASGGIGRKWTPEQGAQGPNFKFHVPRPRSCLDSPERPHPFGPGATSGIGSEGPGVVRHGTVSDAALVGRLRGLCRTRAVGAQKRLVGRSRPVEG